MEEITMMKERIQITNCKTATYHIAWEPGDCTRYEFFVMLHEEIFYIMSLNSFPTPRQFDYYTLRVVIGEYEKKDITAEEAVKNLYEGKEKINPHTVLQYARAIYQLSEGIK
jgi:hypothetical protein